MMLKKEEKTFICPVAVVKTPSYGIKIRLCHIANFSAEDSLFFFFSYKKDVCLLIT